MNYRELGELFKLGEYTKRLFGKIATDSYRSLNGQSPGGLRSVTVHLTDSLRSVNERIVTGRLLDNCRSVSGDLTHMHLTVT